MDVEVTSRRTEWETVYAQADGRLRLDSSVAAVRTWKNRDWVDVDRSVVSSPDGFTVAAAVAPMVFSDGRDGVPLAKIRRHGTWVSVDLPFDLPAPEVELVKVIMANTTEVQMARNVANPPPVCRGGCVWANVGLIVGGFVVEGFASIEGGILLGSLFARLEARMAANTARVFSSTDAYVADAANAVERALPGRVQGVNSQVQMASGLSREVDVDLGDLIVQVKSGNARGLTGQLQATTATTGRTAIGYAPDIPNAAWEAAARQGVPIARTPGELVAIVKELGG